MIPLGVLQQQTAGGGEVVAYEPKFVLPLWTVYNEQYYGEYARHNVTGIIPDGRTISGTFAINMPTQGTNYALLWMFERSSYSTTGAVCYWVYDAANDYLRLEIKRSDDTSIYSYSFSSQTISGNGTLVFAFNLDLDDIAGSYWAVNGGTQTAFSGTALADNIAWSEVAACGAYGGGGGLTNHFDTIGGTGGVGLCSVSNINNLDLSAIWDGSGYTLNPGPQFSNWYATQPLAAFATAPFRNNGWYRYLGGMNYHVDPQAGWIDDPDYTTGCRRRKTQCVEHGAVRLNQGIPY